VIKHRPDLGDRAHDANSQYAARVAEHVSL
jgi:hypothetical protein